MNSVLCFSVHVLVELTVRCKGRLRGPCWTCCSLFVVSHKHMILKENMWPFGCLSCNHYRKIKGTSLGAPTFHKLYLSSSEVCEDTRAGTWGKRLVKEIPWEDRWKSPEIERTKNWEVEEESKALFDKDHLEYQENVTISSCKALPMNHKQPAAWYFEDKWIIHELCWKCRIW